MKNILKLLSGIVFLVSSLMISSCSEEFLTKQPIGVVPGAVVNSPTGVEKLLLGVYERMQAGDMFGAALASDWTYAGGCSDDAYKGTSAGDQSNFNLLEQYKALPSNPYLNNRWTACYDGVARANVCLETLWALQKTTNKMDDARAKQVEAEAKFLRAWFHFQANKIFENIPYVKTATETGTTPPENTPNSDPGWAPMEEDLQFAIDNLPTTKINGEAGRITKYAAEAYKAQAHMYQKEYALAKPLLDDIINSAKFTLATEYTYNFDMTHENNSESIFELQCTTTATGHSAVAGSGCNFHQKGDASCGGWGFYQPSQTLFNAFQVDAQGLPVLDINARVNLAIDMGKASSADFTPTTALLDPRVDFLIARRGVDFLGWGIHPGNDWIREQNNGGPMMTKIFMHRKDEQSMNLNGSGFSNGKNFRMMRYASILLWRAEVALQESSPDLALARTYVNMVRNRAKGSTPVMGLCSSTKNLTSSPVVDWTKPAANYKVEPYGAVGVFPFDTKANALKAVQMETQLEFALQNHRFFDLRRWGLLGTVIPDYITRDKAFRVFMQTAVFNESEDDFWPIPQNVIDLQKEIIKQDPAY
jgi:hypothetical protein